MIDYTHILSHHIAQLQQSGNYRYFLDVDKSAQQFPHFYYEDADGDKCAAINWCSNDYLCMSVHEGVIRELNAVAHHSGIGSGGTRNISGTTVYHRALEKALAAFHHKESALLFGSAYIANLTSLYAIGKLLPDCVFVSDEKNHASLIEGIKASGCKKHIVRHNDMAHLEETLQQLPPETPTVIVCESVYSISGTVSPLADVVALAKKYNCLTYVDEVHAVGLYGSNGSGIAQQQGVHEHVDIINGTLAKGIGVIGGYIAANPVIIDCIRSYGSGFIFTTSLPPAVCAAALYSLQYISASSDMRKEYHANVELFRSILQQHGIPLQHNTSHITPIGVGGAVRCTYLAHVLLHDYGIYVQPINYPTVPSGEECLRFTVTVKHSRADMEHAAQSLSKVLQ